ncbi:MAG: hypothetical protein ABEJ65_03180 [bacterium]
MSLNGLRSWCCLLVVFVLIAGCAGGGSTYKFEGRVEKSDGNIVLIESDGDQYILKKSNKYQEFESLVGKKQVKFGGSTLRKPNGGPGLLKVERHKWINPALKDGDE